MTHTVLSLSLLLITTHSSPGFGADPIDTSTTDTCAYSASGVVATPLGTCSVYAQSATAGRAYSYQYDYDAVNDALTCSYYTDLSCDALETSYWMDSEMMAQHNIHARLSGAGSACETVDITKHGSYSPDSDECSSSPATQNDYFSMTYVLNECVSSPAPMGSDSEAGGAGFSAVLLCDAEKIYFNYYADCTGCDASACEMTQYVYHFYGEDCWDIRCNALSELDVAMDINSASATSQFSGGLSPHAIVAGGGAEFVTHLLNGDAPWMGPSLGAQTEMDGLVSAQSVDWPSLSLRLLLIIGAVVLVASCGICRYINRYQRKMDYAPIGDGIEMDVAIE